MTRHRLAIALLSMLLSFAAQGEIMRADVIVFLRPANPDLPVRHKAGTPDDRSAIAIDDAVGLKLAGITVLPENDFGLVREWKALKATIGYEPLLKLAYVQNDPPASKGPALRLYQPAGDCL